MAEDPGVGDEGVRAAGTAGAEGEGAVLDEITLRQVEVWGGQRLVVDCREEIVKLESGSEPSGEGAFSADLVVESPVGEKGRAVLVFDFQRGEGMGLGFATAPNGAATGYNPDIEGFNDTSVHLTQAYYERDVNERLSFSAGQLDITGYFDANEFANDERSSFMAPVFVNNPVIEFGGSEDFYALGVRATCAPTENISVTLGAFEGDGDYTDTFGKPFLMAEADFALKLFGMDGNYRVYYWYRGARPDVLSTATPSNAALLL